MYSTDLHRHVTQVLYISAKSDHFLYVKDTVNEKQATNNLRIMNSDVCPQKLGKQDINSTSTYP